MSAAYPSDLDDLLGQTVAVDLAPGGVAASSGASASAGGVAYDGSSVTNQLAMWAPALRSADGDLLSEKPMLDARARDTLRNDAYVAGGSAILKDSIVGAQFVLNAKPETKVLFGKEDEQWENEFQEEVETKFALWAESPQNWPDASRINTLTGLVRLAVGVHTAGGEVLAANEWMPKDGRPFRTALQMIDADRLSTPYDRAMDKRIRNGVERDSRGAPVAYHIRVTHPSDVRFGTDYAEAYRWERVPARKPWGRQMILHIYEQMRPDQSRGVAGMVAALSEMRMTKHFRKVQLEQAVVASTYAASIESDLPPAEVYAAMGAGGDGNPTVDWMSDYLEAVNEYSGGAKNLHIEGTRIPVFAPGTHLKIQNPGTTGPSGDAFEASLLRHIAAALGVSYEQLSHDYSKTNYSSARAAFGEVRKGMATRKKLVADTTASFIYRAWMEEAINRNLLESLKRPNIPAFYDGLNSEAYCACDWIGAGQGMVDPLKETQADVLAIKNGLDTKEAVISRRSGGDWRKVARQVKRERVLDEDLGNVSAQAAEISQMEKALSGTPQERQS